MRALSSHDGSRPEADVRRALDTDAPSLDHPALENTHGRGYAGLLPRAGPAFHGKDE